MQSDAQLLNRISVDSETMAGKPVIKGTRLTVEFILNLLAHGASYEEILREYPGLTQEDLRLVCFSPVNPWQKSASCHYWQEWHNAFLGG